MSTSSKKPSVRIGRNACRSGVNSGRSGAGFPLAPANAQCLGVDLGLVCAGLGVPSAFSHPNPYYYGYPYTGYPYVAYPAYTYPYPSYNPYYPITPAPDTPISLTPGPIAAP